MAAKQFFCLEVALIAPACLLHFALRGMSKGAGGSVLLQAEFSVIGDHWKELWARSRSPRCLSVIS